MYKLLTKKMVGIITTILYLLIVYCLIMKEANGFIDATLPVGAQYGVIFVINAITTVATIFISYGIINILVKFIIDMNYNDFVSLYNILMIINLLKVLCNILVKMLQLPRNSIIEIMIIIVSNVVLYAYFRNEKADKNKTIFLYCVVCVVEIITNIWS